MTRADLVVLHPTVRGQRWRIGLTREISGDKWGGPSSFVVCHPQNGGRRRKTLVCPTIVATGGEAFLPGESKKIVAICEPDSARWEGAQ